MENSEGEYESQTTSSQIVIVVFVKLRQRRLEEVSYFFSLSSSASLWFSRSFTESRDSFRSASSFRLVRSMSTRCFFSCSREPSTCCQKVVSENRLLR